MFYDNYIRACALRGEKPTPVAQKVGCTSSNIAQWKKGSTPRSAVLQKIADYLEVSPQYLMFGDIGSDENEDVKKEATEIGDLSETELELIELFRKLPAETQETFPALLEATLKARGLL